MKRYLLIAAAMLIAAASAHAKVYYKGDVNRDNVVDVVDINAVINVILNGTYESKADVNEDGCVDVVDINAVVNYITTGELVEVRTGVDYVWNMNEIPEIHLYVSLDEWNRLLALYDSNEKTKQYIVADMDFRCAPPIIEALKKVVDHGIFGYSFPESACFEAVKNWLSRRQKWDIKTDWIIITSGIVPAVTYAVQEFTEKGDGVLIQTPVYYPFKDSCIKLNERRPEEALLIEENGVYTIDFEDFEAKASKPDVKLFILCSPHNPVGRVWTEEELGRMVEICQKHDVLIFADEIHSDLIMRGYSHTPTGLITEKNLIAAYAPSKTFNLAGLKMSAIVIPDDTIRRRYKHRIAVDQAGGVNSFGPAAMTAAYDECEDWLEELIDYIDDNEKYALSYINEKIPGLRASVTEGTYFLWVDFRATGLDTETINRRVLETAKVAGDLGGWFGKAGDGFVRFNLACPRATVDEMLRRLQAAFGQE